MSLHEMFEKLEDRCYPNGTTAFQWTAKGCGFGEFYFYTKEGDNTIYCDNEMMSKEFVKKMLCEMVDNAVMNDPNPKDQEDGKEP